jgi:hypothetical protein
MDEFFFNLLLMLAEVIAEFLLELTGEAIFSLALRAIGEVFVDSQVVRPVLATIGYLLLGAMTGGSSVLLFPHPLVPPSRIHGISLLVSPVATGFAMSRIGAALRGRGRRTTPLETFGYGFAFAFGMALIRFFFVK